MASFDPPEPPFEPGEPTPPPALLVPLPPPEVGFGSPFVPADAENRDRILDWWRMWWRRVFFPWVAAFTEYWGAQWDRLAEYVNTWITAADEYISEHAIAGYSWRTTASTINPTVGQTTAVVFTGVDQEHRPLVVGDLVSDQTYTKTFGIITAVIDATHATVTTIGQLSGFNGHGWWLTVTDIAHGGATPVVLVAEAGRPPQVGDFVMDDTASVAYGKITAVTDDTHVTVTYIGILQGPQGIQGIPGPQGDPGDPGVVQSIVAGPFITVDDTDPANPIVSGTTGGAGVDTVVAGTNITVDATDPNNPIVSATGGGGGGTVDSVVAGDNVTVDATDPANPIVSAGSPGSALVESIVAGTNVTVDDTDPANPIVSASGGGGGVVDSVVAGDRITVDDTDPANPIVSAANGIPLNVFATIDRPPALEDGDAYFDSTLIIPVWSYGGEWRDSDGTPVLDPPEPDDVDVVGGGSGPTLTGYRLAPGFGGKNQFNNYQYVEFEGALFSGPVHDIPINPDPGDGNILLRFNGTTVTAIPVPGFITPRDYIRTGGIWVVAGVLYLVVSTLDLTTGDADTYYMSYTTAGGFTNLPVSGQLGAAYVDHVSFATDGSFYLDADLPTGSGRKMFWAADAVTPPVVVEGDSVTAVSIFDTFAVGNGAVAYNPTMEDVERIVSGEFTFSYGPETESPNSFPVGDTENRNQAVLMSFNTDPSTIFYAGTSEANTAGLAISTHGLGFLPTGRVWVSAPDDLMGDHVAFNVMFGGTMWGGATGVYLNGHAYIEVSDETHNYLAIFAVSY